MEPKIKSYWKPGRFNNSENSPRKAGFEIEFGNLSVKETAEAIQKCLGGNIREFNSFIFEITNSDIGKLKIERDAELLNSPKYRETLEKLNIDFNPGTLAREIEQGIDKLSSLLIPCEIVTEPLLFKEFPKLLEIEKVLNSLNAEGTQGSVFYAFGLHINPSVPDLDAKTLVCYLQSFLLLTDWIIEDSGIDFSRRFLTSFIDPFPDLYFTRILSSEYLPTIEELIDDYLEFNPTRNRALDMLPLFCMVDQDRVLAGIEQKGKSLLKGRPAFHYRLPDCRIGDKNWSIANEWNRWWYVEMIAENNQLRSELIQLWNENTRKFFMTRKIKWIDVVKKFIKYNIKTPDDD